MKGPKTVYICTECGYQTSKWLGKCPECSSWNTLEEEVISASAAGRKSAAAVTSSNHAKLFSEFDEPDYIRTETGFKELDRVLGGGIVKGSAILLSGEPGIGKSTILMQISGKLTDRFKVLYVSGEESGGQLKLRAKRLGTGNDGLYILIETDMDVIMREIESISPDIVIIDSIQTVHDNAISSSSGSVTQVREAAAKFVFGAKTDGYSVIIVSHVNKDGAIAGPKVLEHAVDAVLYFEGDKRSSNRIIRAVKNRFGSTNEIGVFSMGGSGLVEVSNPSKALLEGRPVNTPGNCAVCLSEGTRPIIAEIQALAAKTSFASPRRSSNGIDLGRLYMLLAVLEKRLGLKFYENDVYLNVIGGLKIDEPAADLAIALALISSIRDTPVPDDLLAFGEIGLSGEIRAVVNAEQRISEAEKLGFSRVMVPHGSVSAAFAKKCGAQIIPVKSVYEVILSGKGLFSS